MLPQLAEESCSWGPLLEAEDGELMAGCASSLVPRCPVTYGAGATESRGGTSPFVRGEDFQ